MTKQELVTLELKLQQEDVRSDKKQLAQLVHDNYLEFGRSGKVWKKADLLVSDQKIPQLHIQSSEFSVQKVGERSYLVSYLTTEQETGKQTNRRSLWVKEENAWQLLFHEGNDFIEGDSHGSNQFYKWSAS